jgi:hypothetical protein
VNIGPSPIGVAAISHTGTAIAGTSLSRQIPGAIAVAQIGTAYGQHTTWQGVIITAMAGNLPISIVLPSFNLKKIATSITGPRIKLSMVIIPHTDITLFHQSGPRIKLSMAITSTHTDITMLRNGTG